jgi:hypothetical protein
MDPVTFEQFLSICDTSMMGLLIRYVKAMPELDGVDAEIRRAAMLDLFRVSYRRLSQFSDGEVEAGFKIVVDANQRAEWEDGREHLLNLVQTLWVDDDDIEILPPPWRDR